MHVMSLILLIGEDKSENKSEEPIDLMSMGSSLL